MKRLMILFGIIAIIILAVYGFSYMPGDARGAQGTDTGGEAESLPECTAEAQCGGCPTGQQQTGKCALYQYTYSGTTAENPTVIGTCSICEAIPEQEPLAAQSTGGDTGAADAGAPAAGGGAPAGGGQNPAMDMLKQLAQQAMQGLMGKMMNPENPMPGMGDKIGQADGFKPEGPKVPVDPKQEASNCEKFVPMLEKKMALHTKLLPELAVETIKTSPCNPADITNMGLAKCLGTYLPTAGAAKGQYISAWQSTFQSCQSYASSTCSPQMCITYKTVPPPNGNPAQIAACSQAAVQCDTTLNGLMTAAKAEDEALKKAAIDSTKKFLDESAKSDVSKIPVGEFDDFVSKKLTSITPEAASKMNLDQCLKLSNDQRYALLNNIQDKVATQTGGVPGNGVFGAEAGDAATRAAKVDGLSAGEGAATLGRKAADGAGGFLKETAGKMAQDALGKAMEGAGGGSPPAGDSGGAAKAQPPTETSSTPGPEVTVQGQKMGSYYATMSDGSKQQYVMINGQRQYLKG